MREFIGYNLEVFLCLATFYGFYYVSLRRETNHRFVRTYLLGALVLSFVLPLVSFDILSPAVGEAIPTIQLPVFETSAQPAAKEGVISSISALSWSYLYAGAMVVFLLTFLAEVFKIYRIRKSKRKQTADFQGFEVVIHASKYPTFSFMNTIYLAQEDLNPEASRERILLHEASHIKGAHSIDIIALELLRIVFWVNPMIYLYKNALILSHEYIADQDSVAADDQQKYVNLLVNQTLSNLGLSLGSHFGRKSGILPQWPWANGLSINKSQTLKRIKMIKNTSKMNKLKYLIPVVAIALSTIVVSCVQDENANEISDQLSETEKVEITSATEVQGDIFQIVDNAPAFIGGNPALYKYLGENINYPQQARKLGVQGRVFVQFVITKDGKVADTQVLKGIGAGCDAEALRVISEMPDWSPGTQKGIPVNVRMVLPISFRLPELETNKEDNISEGKSLDNELVVNGYQN